MPGQYFFISLIFSLPFANAYPALPPAFAFQPSQQHLAMAAAGIEPILPINYPPGLSPMTLAHAHGRHPSAMLTSPIPMSLFAGANRNGDQQFQQLAMSMGGQNQPQMFIRNSPYQPSPFRYATSSSLQGLQQPIFPQGMAIGKSAYGMHPSSAILPSDIPMEMLIGRQMVQNGIDGASQTVNGRHPFPLSPMFGGQVNSLAESPGSLSSSSSSSFGGAFGADPFQMRNQQQPAEEKQEFESRLEERIPLQPTSPSVDSTAPAHSPFVPPPVISAESSLNSVASTESPSASQSASQNSLPVFLRGAPQEFIDEFKRIIRQPNSTYATQIGKIDELVQKMDPERQLMYREFMRENDERERLHRDRVHKTVAEMSDKAQEQFAKISATLRNPNMPDQDRWDRVLQLYGKMDPDLRNEFEQKFKGFPTISPQ